MWLQMAQRYHSSDERTSPRAEALAAQQREHTCATTGEPGRVTLLMSAKFAPLTLR